MEFLKQFIATASIWGGVAGLSWLFHTLGVLTSSGAAALCLGAFVLTASILYFWTRAS